MTESVNTVIIGGGVLGCASAISTQKRLRKANGNNDDSVCLVEKSVISSGISARHSGIVRSANAVARAAKLAKSATDYWKNLVSIWGVQCEYESNGAIWIAKDTGSGKNKQWSKLAESLANLNIQFGQVDKHQAQEICTKNVNLRDDEVFYFEPGAIQFDPTKVRKALYEAIKINNINIKEKTNVRGFLTDDNGKINKVLTDNGDINCQNVVNAAGAWSPSIFDSLGINIPVSIETVNVVNWLTSQFDIDYKMPIIADYTNLAYFRLWRNGEIHMHQPRHRNTREIARTFSENPLHISGGDLVNDPTNQSLGYGQIRIYEDIARKRFSDLEKSIYSSGYRSYFDITPDLKFILGRDSKVSNLFHCLGSGQGFKYAPVFGELIADCITNEGKFLDEVGEFAISRFDDSYMENFWSQVSGSDNTLEAETATL